MTPCIYELNDEREAVHVRWFCGEMCRDKWPKGPKMEYGTDDEWIKGTVCDECGNPLAEFLHEAVSRRNNLVSLINTYNESSSPSVPRTDAEHAIERERAKIALGSIRRNYTLGVDYKELSNGALWPLEVR